MPTWLKVTVILIAIFFALLVATVFMGYHAAVRLADDAKKTTDEASTFAHGREAPACVDEAVARAVKCNKADAFCLMRAQIFLTNCVDHARIPPDFCASVPARNGLQIRNRWSAEECARRGHPGDARCNQMLESLQIICTSKR
jgi:hypothetical protein